jgi:uncharacterized protein YggE
MRPIALLFLSMALLLGAAPSHAAETRYVTVAGEGSVAAEPDMAEASAGVITRGRTASAALADNEKAAAKVLEALTSGGIEPRDVKTSRVSLHPVFERNQGGAEARITGYEAVNQVTLRVRDLGKLGALLDALAAAGANRVDQLRFSVSEPHPLMDEARKRAVMDARQRAQIMAEAAGASLGQIVSIEETGQPMPRPMAMPFDQAVAKAVPISPGEQDIRASIMARFALE